MKPAPGLLVLALSLLSSAAPAGPAHAGPSPEARIVLHVVPERRGAPGGCAALELAGPDAVRTEGPLFPTTSIVYVLVAGHDRGEGLAGVQFGLEYDARPGHGVDALAWSRCAALEFPAGAWPASGSGNLFTWSQTEDCRHEEPVVVGWLRVTAHSPDILRVVPRPSDGIAAVAACGVRVTRVSRKVDHLAGDALGRVAFGGGSGFNPWRKTSPDSIDSDGRSH